MPKINGEKIERVMLKIFDIFEKEEVSGNEGSAIAGMIMSNSAGQQAKSMIEKDLRKGRRGGQ